MKCTLYRHHVSVVVTIVVVTWIIVSLGANAVQPEIKSGLLSRFKVGQSIVLAEKESRFEIRPIADAAGRTHSVLEVGADYVMLRDLIEEIDLMIPVYSIKAVVRVKE
jgi:hypothetical protein